MIYQKLKTALRLFFALLLATTGLSLLLSTINPNVQLSNIAAQEPRHTPSYLVNISEERLASIGLTAESIQATGGPTDLEIVKTTNVSTVTSGSLVTYSILITNNGHNPISYTAFYDDYPAQMQNVSFTFSKDAIPFSNVSNPEWLIYEPILVGNSVSVIVTGILTSGPDITVTNTAVVTPIGPDGDIDTDNNTAEAQVGIVGYSPLTSVYLPLVFKAPPPPPIKLIYHENFNDGDAWFEFDSNGCETENRNGQYWVDLDSSGRECFPPARDENKPQSPYRTYGEFEVTAYDSGEGESDASYGIFINGQGGNNYYLFRIWPNNGCSSGGDWELRRRRSGSTKTVLSGDCHSAINRGYGGDTATNILKITHTQDRKLSLYINDQLIETFTDSTSNHLTGEGVGVYLRSDNKHIRVKFDDFKVYKYN